MMGNYEQLKSAIAAVIKTNGNNEITGALLQQVLIGMTSQIGANMTFRGIATPATQPATPDQNCFYMATERGTYSNFDGQELDGTKLAIFFNSSGAWRSWLMPIVDFTFDNTPTEDSTNPVTSDGIFKALMQHDDMIFFSDVNGTKYEVEYVWNPRVQDWDEVISDTPLEINPGKIYINHISFDMFTSPYAGAWIQLNAMQTATYSGTIMTEQTAIAPTGVISKMANNVTTTYDLPSESGTLALASDIASARPMRVTATWDASASDYTYESAVDVDTMYQSFYSQGKVLELHLVNGNYNGLVLTCHGGYTSNNERHLKFSGSGDGKLIEADVVGTAVTVSYNDINEISRALYDKQDKTLATSTIPATGLLPNVVYDYGTTDSVSVTLAAGETGVANIWCFVFTAQTAACTVTLPSSVVLGNEYAWDMVAGRRYEVSIMDNVAIVNYSD